jgi:hypothetical protein
MGSAAGRPASPGRGCPIRTSPDQSLLAAPRSFSQPSTSFIGSRCQGIHRAPLLARRLDLSTSPSRQDQLSLLLARPPRPLAARAPSMPCSTTLALSMCRPHVQPRGPTPWAKKAARHPPSRHRHERDVASAFMRLAWPRCRCADSPWLTRGACTRASRLLSIRLEGPAWQGPRRRPTVEPRGFEPPTSAVQRRRSPG